MISFDTLRAHLLFQASCALLLGPFLYHLTAYARHWTAPMFVGAARVLWDPAIEPSTFDLVALNSTHAFVAGLIAAAVGLAMLRFAFAIDSMLLPLISSASFIVTANWWVFTRFFEVAERASPGEMLIDLTGRLAAVLAWLLASWLLVRWYRKRRDSAAG